jgi:hypothetical protein
MAIDLPSYLESIDSISHNAATMSTQEGRAPWTYILNAPTVNDLATFIVNVFGTTDITVSTNGVLNRTLPLTHPLWPSFYAASISSIHGIGSPTVQPASFALLNLGTQIPQMALYPKYAITIDFAPRIYSLTTNGAIPAVQGTWYPPVLPGFLGGNSAAENPLGYFYAGEWVRYTTFKLSASPEYVTAKQAAMRFFAPSLFQAPGFLWSTAPSFPGLIQKFLNNQMLKVWWYQVPYRYIYSLNSYIRQAIGRINQYPWYWWDAGQLLFLNYNVNPYISPFPQYDKPFSGRGLPQAFETVVNQSLLVDIELDFLVTTRQLAAADGGAANVIAKFPQVAWQMNWLIAHHNLMPYWADNQFHYVGRGVDSINLNPPHADNASAGTPPFLSFPFELLFTDPDTPGNTIFA